VNDLFDYALRSDDDSDMMGVTIHNEVNLLDRKIYISFRRKDQLSEEVIWSVFSKVAQSNARYNAMDRLIVVVQSVRMTVGFGRKSIRSKGQPLDVAAHVKKSIIRVKSDTVCLAHALIIDIARLENDPDYKSYRDGRKRGPVVQSLLGTTGIDLQDGGRDPEIRRFQDHFTEYKIVVYSGLNCEDILVGEVTSEMRVNLLVDEVNRHYHVITILAGAMSKRYICEACNQSC